MLSGRLGGRWWRLSQGIGGGECGRVGGGRERRTWIERWVLEVWGCGFLFEFELSLNKSAFLLGCCVMTHQLCRVCQLVECMSVVVVCPLLLHCYIRVESLDKSLRAEVSHG